MDEDELVPDHICATDPLAQGIVPKGPGLVFKQQRFPIVWRLIQDEVAGFVFSLVGVAVIVLGQPEVGAGIISAAATNYFKNKTSNGKDHS